MMMLNTTFQERSCWVSLVATGLVASWFFPSTLAIQADAEVPERASLIAATSLAAVAVGLLVVVQVVGHVIAAVVSKPEDEDERDRQISLRADQVSGILLGVGVISAIGHLLASGWYEDPWLQSLASPIGMLNMLVGALVLAEVGRCLTQILLYRRDA